MKNVLIIGEALIDRYSNKDDIKNEVGGASFNVACCISKIGENSIFLGSIGNDKEGEQILSLAKKFNTNLNFVQIVDSKTTVALVTLDENNDRNFEFLRGADENYKFKETDFQKNKIEFIHFGSATAFLGGNLEQSYYDCLEYAIKNKIEYSFDPNFRDKLWITKEQILKFKNLCNKFLFNAKIVKLSEEELNLLSEGVTIKDKIVNLGNKNKEAIICVTLGEKGTLTIHNNNVMRVDSVKSVNVLDTTGAGDVFISKLICEYINSPKIDEKVLFEIVQKSNLFAKNAVERLGALTFLEDK